MASVVLAVVALTWLAVCSAVPTKKESDAICPVPAIYDPVCDDDGNFYTNTYAARCAGKENSEVSFDRCGEKFTSMYDDVLKVSPPEVPPCGCPLHSLQEHIVCGRTADGEYKTYDNDCMAVCNKNTIVVHGEACTDAELRGEDNSPEPEIDTESEESQTDDTSETAEDDNNDDAYGSPDKRTKLKLRELLAKNRQDSFAKKSQKTLANNNQNALAKNTQNVLHKKAQKTVLEPNKRSCSCIRIYAPVCANNGIDYSNENCASECGGAERWASGTCADICPDCVRDRAFKPVCDEEGILYRNSCVAAQCFNVEDYEEATDGKC